MEKTIEQHYVIKFCAKLNKSFADAHQMIQEAYGDSDVSYPQVSRWLKLFENEREKLEDAYALDGRQLAKITKMCLVVMF